MDSHTHTHTLWDIHSVTQSLSHTHIQTNIHSRQICKPLAPCALDGVWFFFFFCHPFLPNKPVNDQWLIQCWLTVKPSRHYNSPAPGSWATATWNTALYWYQCLCSTGPTIATSRLMVVWSQECHCISKEVFTLRPKGEQPLLTMVGAAGNGLKALFRNQALWNQKRVFSVIIFCV